MPAIFLALLISIFSFAGLLVTSPAAAAAEDTGECSSYLSRSEVDRLSKAGRFTPEYLQHLRCVLQTIGLDARETDSRKADARNRLDCKSALAEATQKSQSQLELLATQNYLVTKTKSPKALKRQITDRSVVERYVACQAYSLLNVDALRQKNNSSSAGVPLPAASSGSAR